MLLERKPVFMKRISLMENEICISVPKIPFVSLHQQQQICYFVMSDFHFWALFSILSCSIFYLLWDLEWTVSVCLKSKNFYAFYILINKYTTYIACSYTDEPTGGMHNPPDNRVLIDFFVLQLTKIFCLLICGSKINSCEKCKVFLLGLSSERGSCA